MACLLCERVANRKTEAMMIAEFARCFVVLGDNQGCAGWCTLLLKEHVEHLDELSIAAQGEVFDEVSRVARAIRRVFPTHGKGGGPVRINYECLGNVAPHVHWHVVPRHADDPTPTQTVWGWSAEELRGAMTNAQREALVTRLRVEMARNA